MPKIKKCSTPGCKKPRAHHRTICWTCSARKYRKDHPLFYGYHTLRTNARRRGKSFDITLEEFKQFCEQSGYLDGKGRNGDCLSVDRIDPCRGYSLDNIQVLTVSQNSVKKYTDDAPF